MAIYKQGTNVVPADSGLEAFDKTYGPGTLAPHSGIYRCDTCGDENACNKGDPLPPQNKHQHSGPGPIKWRLLVYAQQQ